MARLYGPSPSVSTGSCQPARSALKLILHLAERASHTQPPSLINKAACHYPDAVLALGEAAALAVVSAVVSAASVRLAAGVAAPFFAAPVVVPVDASRSAVELCSVGPSEAD
jgi:hypothetical protein